MTAFTEANTFDATVTQIDDGDDVSALITNAPLQALVNRSHYLKLLLDAGLALLKPYADATALRAVTTHVNGSVASVANVGLFCFSPTSSTTDDGVGSIKPTDVGGGAGRWLNPAMYLLARANTWAAAQTFSSSVTAASVSTTGGGNITAAGSLNSTGGCLVGTDLFVGTTCLLTGLVTCNAGLADPFIDAIDCNGSIDVSGTSKLHGAVDCYGGLSTTSFGATGSVTCNDTLTVMGTSTCVGKISAQAGVDITGNSTLTKPVACSSTGRVVKRVVTGVDADHTYSINDADQIIVASLTADRSYTLGTTGAANGDVIQIATQEATDALTILRPAGDDDVVMRDAASNIVYAEFTYQSGHWYVTMLHKRAALVVLDALLFCAALQALAAVCNVLAGVAELDARHPARCPRAPCRAAHRSRARAGASPAGRAPARAARPALTAPAGAGLEA